ncbi:hypothetical protein SeseC_01078 [Streptococcus equi subsp. zooepidemicus ATCC 35246]|nr:hypothetical protein SeseC_01078 [Streptococcus equi subsp. zooepidemicus ATCC 35246]
MENDCINAGSPCANRPFRLSCEQLGQLVTSQKLRKTFGRTTDHPCFSR